MVRRVMPVMQHESPEATSAYDVGHAVHTGELFTV